MNTSNLTRLGLGGGDALLWSRRAKGALHVTENGKAESRLPAGHSHRTASRSLPAYCRHDVEIQALVQASLHALLTVSYAVYDIQNCLQQ